VSYRVRYQCNECEHNCYIEMDRKRDIGLRPLCPVYQGMTMVVPRFNEFKEQK